ncbi:hypothetical protein [Caulobacter sp. NIBR1757]|uniref:hypothetical protein n=1 Tax=Caulobacter sp. NIBR1757 TaxID=3016000 RepID=UPI0022F01765|nr:hypothetical protein [Caulobacter sp. NIBR1757]
MRLEAQHASPLPDGQVSMDLRRLDAWRPGASARFAAAYFRSCDVTGPVSHSHTIGGREVVFSVGGAANSGSRTRSAIPFVAAAIGAAGLIAGCLVLSASDREVTDQVLEDERVALRAARSAGEATERQISEHAVLAAAGLRDQQMSSVLEDLVWLTRAKDPTVGVTAIEWRPDSLVVQTHPGRLPVVTKDRPIEQVGPDRWRIERASTAGDARP